MDGVLVTFVAGAAVLWLSVFGYPLALRLFARRPSGPESESAERPRVAVVVPVLDEEALITAKLADLRRTDYPADRLRVVVVDGGSHDGTVAAVRREIDRGLPIRLLETPGRRGKFDQINHAFRHLEEEIAVVTDADAVLDPACIGELVRALERDRRTAIVGATVRPASALLEERVHWWLLNRIWWLEGEVLSAAMVSGVCYAARRSLLDVLPAEGAAEDARLTLAAGARGLRVRLCRTALATEVRVPQTSADLLAFRRRRGTDYVRELRRVTPPGRLPLGWRMARGLRLWHFLVTPRVGLALILLGVALLFSRHWLWAVAAFAAFAAPAFAAVARGTAEESDQRGWWRIGVATARLIALTWLALLTLTRYAPQRP